MTNLEVLIADGCTAAEAKKHLKRGSIVFEDFEENFNSYMDELEADEEEREEYKTMIDKKEPMSDWGIVEDSGKTYYIMYVL